jgi:hypothetical protein
MLAALLYLRVRSLQNLLASRTRRLREPKYLAGAIATVLYFYYFVFRRLALARGALGGHGANPLLLGGPLFVLALSIGYAAAAWVFPSSQGGLRFAPAEIAFLFPAPLSRRQLVHFSLAGSQARLLFSSLLLALVWGRPPFTAWAMAQHAAGWWILLATADLHRTAANLVFARRRDRGANPAVGRIVALGGVVLFVAAMGAAVGWQARVWPAFAGPATLQVWGSLLTRLTDSGPLRGLLLPFRLAAGPFLAEGGRAFAAALPAALLLLAAHYAWIVRLDVSFAEGSISLAEKRAQRVAALQAGGSPFAPASVRPRREPFRLAPRGRPEGAFLWKNLFSVSGAVNWRLAFAVAAAVLPVVAVLSVLFAGSARHGGVNPLGAIAAVGSAVLGAYVLLLGPQLARQDLRSDLANVDLLKTYPLPGWQVVLGEMLAPIALLSGLLWLLLLAASWGIAASQLTGLSGPVRLAATLGAACLIPPVCALELLVPNAMMLLFPAWHQATRSRGGIDQIGQRMIFMVGIVVSVVILLLPSVLAVPVLIFATAWLIGPVGALLVATVGALALIGFELVCGIWWLGQRFERLDLSAELRP